MSEFKQHAFFLKSGVQHLSAACFLPDEVRAAVLFVPPFAEERKGALPVLVQTARLLAEHKIAALLFDFTGCGDSSGDFASVDPSHFMADTEAALAWLEQTFPALPKGLVGIRTGACLASQLAARRHDIAALALWSPLSGSEFLRQLLQRRMVNDMVAYGKAQESRASIEARLRKGEAVDVDGYAISSAFFAWLQDLALQPAPQPSLLSTGGHDEKGLADFLTTASQVTRSELRHPPFWNTVGHVDLTALVNATTVWLDSHLKGAEAVPAPMLAPFEATPDGELISLSPVPEVRAFVDRPSQTPHGGILFLHGWSGDRTGPHRLFVQAARQFSAEGFLCVRPDFVGRGLSDGSDADTSIARMAENAQTALAALRTRLPPGAPVAVLAICSGCKVAIALASKNLAVDRLLLWSAESMGSLRSPATGLRKTLSACATYASKLTRPETWKKILQGKVQTRMVTKALVKHETRSATEAAWEDGVLRVFRAYRRPILFVYGGSDPDVKGSSRAYTAYCKRHGIPHALHLIAHAGHSYYGGTWSRELIDVSRSFLSD